MIITCYRCGHTWDYKGKKRRPPCWKCNNKPAQKPFPLVTCVYCKYQYRLRSNDPVYCPKCKKTEHTSIEAVEKKNERRRAIAVAVLQKAREKYGGYGLWLRRMDAIAKRRQNSYDLVYEIVMADLEKKLLAYYARKRKRSQHDTKESKTDEVPPQE